MLHIDEVLFLYKHDKQVLETTRYPVLKLLDHGGYTGRQHFMVVVHARGRQAGKGRSQVGRRRQMAGVVWIVRGHAVEEEVAGLIVHVVVLDGGSARTDVARV